MSLAPTVWDAAESVFIEPSNVFTNGDRTAQLAAWSRCFTLFTATAGKYYFELTTTVVDSSALNHCLIGMQAQSEGTGPGYDLEGRSINLRDGKKRLNGDAPIATAYPGDIGTDRVIGVYIDFDAQTLGIVSHGGTEYPSVLIDMNPATWRVSMGFENNDSGMGTNPVTANFGDVAFVHPVPSGYIAGYGGESSGIPQTLPTLTGVGYGGANCERTLQALTGVGYGGGSANITLPSAALVMFGPGRGDVHLPHLTSAGFGSSYGAITLPALQVTGYCGGNAAVALPGLTASGHGGGHSAALLPAITFLATGHDSTGERAGDVVLPGLNVIAYGGAFASRALPALRAAGNGTGTVVGIAEMNLPAITVEATGAVGNVGSADLTLMSAYELVGYSGAVIDVTLTGGVTAVASGMTGGVGNAAMTLPMFELEASGSSTFGYADMILPALATAPTGRAWLTLPGLSLVAIGTATVTATYEAYAVNLKHTSDKSPDEVTRYTNFPFTHIVRYQNSYFGANETGLYLLEGPTDYAATPTAIPWEFRTAMTDFGYPEFKTIESAYLGGRLGPAATLTLYAGEGKQTQAYSYTTPRGDLAQNYRQKFGKGIRQHRYYAIGAAGSGELAIDSIDFNVAKLSRRI